MDANTFEPPILDAYRSADGLTLEVWCQYCRTWHQHTAHARQPRLPSDQHGSPSLHVPPGIGPRVAHRHHRNSPYKRNVGLMHTGYVLREVGPFTSEVQHAMEIEIYFVHALEGLPDDTVQ